MSVYRIYEVGNEDQFYIGSTNDLKKRGWCHKKRCKTDNYKLYKYIRNNGGWDNFKMEVLEYCLNYQEREKELIRTLKPPLNTFLYNFNHKEYDKKYREENRDEIIMKDRKRHEKNKDKINKQKKKYYEENRDKFKIYREENRDKIKEKIKIYREENRDKIKEQVKKYRDFRKSWGGDIRYHNNLLQIDITLFN